MFYATEQLDGIDKYFHDCFMSIAFYPVKPHFQFFPFHPVFQTTRVAVTKYRVAFQQQKFISQFLRLEVWDQAASMVGRGPSSGWQAADFLPGPHTTEGARALSGASFRRALVPVIRVLPSGPKYLPKVPSSNTIISGVRISTHELKGPHKHSDHSTQLGLLFQ